METDTKEKDLVLTPTMLETFRKKTQLCVHVIPDCHGGYDKDDILCQNCSVATGDKILVDGMRLMADRINMEDSVWLRTRAFGAPFFAAYTISCAEQRKELENAVSELEAANRMRKERRAIENITRMPVGEVKEGETPFDYVHWYGRDGLWVRLGKSSEKFLYACGILYRFDGLETFREKPSFRPDRIVGYVRSISTQAKDSPVVRLKPEKDDEYFLVFPKRQTESQGTLALEVTRKGEEGKEDETLYIVLEADSYEKVSAKFDDLGIL